MAPPKADKPLTVPDLKIRFREICVEKLKTQEETWWTINTILAAIEPRKTTPGTVLKMLQEIGLKPHYFPAFSNPHRRGTWYRVKRKKT